MEWAFGEMQALGGVEDGWPGIGRELAHQELSVRGFSTTAAWVDPAADQMRGIGDRKVSRALEDLGRRAVRCPD
jgi:hypothetical protein